MVLEELAFLAKTISKPQLSKITGGDFENRGRNVIHHSFLFLSVRLESTVQAFMCTLMMEELNEMAERRQPLIAEGREKPICFS